MFVVPQVVNGLTCGKYISVYSGIIWLFLEHHVLALVRDFRLHDAINTL